MILLICKSLINAFTMGVHGEKAMDQSPCIIINYMHIRGAALPIICTNNPVRSNAN